MSRLPAGLHPRQPSRCNPTKGCRMAKTSLRSLNNNAPLTPFLVKPSACSKRTTCRTWAKFNPTCFKAWLKDCISNRTSLPAPTLNNPFREACRSTSSPPTNSRTINSHHNKVTWSLAGLKPPETTCRTCNVARPLPVALYRTPATSRRWPQAVPKSPTIRPIHRRMPWSTGLLRPSAPSKTNAEVNGFQ